MTRISFDIITICALVALLGVWYATANEIGILGTVFALMIMVNELDAAMDSRSRAIARCMLRHPAGKGRA